MIFILLLLVIVIILIILYFFKNKKSNETFTNYRSIRNIILNNNNFKLNNLGCLNYNSCVFEQFNKHNFVFRQSNNRLRCFGSPITNLPETNIPISSKLYNNHGGYCLLNNGSLTIFGDSDYGGDNVPSNVTSSLNGKTIVSVYSTLDSFCALTNDKNVICWGNQENGGSVPGPINTVIANNVNKIFSNKNTFLCVYSSTNKIICWGSIQIPTDLLDLQNTVNVYSNDTTFIVRYLYSNNNHKIKCFSTSPIHVLNKNNVENINNVKCVYSNSQSFILIYGSSNNVAICGNNNYLGGLDQDFENLNNIVNVVTNHGAYALINNEGNLYSYGKNDFVSSFPQQQQYRTNIKKLYSNYGVFIAVNNEDTAIVWGKESHGYVNSNNIILNVKDVYTNGDNMGGAILFIKKNNDNVICLGNNQYGASSLIQIPSNTIKRIYTSNKAFFYSNNNNVLKLVTGNISDYEGYNANSNYVIDNSSVYTNNFDINKYNNEINNIQYIVNYNDDDLEDITQPVSQTNAVQQNNQNNGNSFYYAWLFENNTNSETNNNSSWDITTDSNNIAYTVVNNNIMMNMNNKEVIFDEKTLQGNSFSISFKLKINEVQNPNFKIFSLLDLFLLHNSVNSLKLYRNSTLLRTINISNNVQLLTFTFSQNNISIFINNNRITYNNQIPYTFNNNTNINFKLGNQVSESTVFTSPQFNIGPLIFLENFELQNEHVNSIYEGSFNFLNNLNQTQNNLRQTTNVIQLNSVNTTSVEEPDIPIVTRSVFERQNYVTINPISNSGNLTIKIKSHLNLNFIRNQVENNLQKLETVKGSFSTENNSFYFNNNIVISKVNSLTYRGLTFQRNTYEDENDDKVYYLFELDNNSLVNLSKFKYLDFDQINKIYNDNRNNGEIFLFIYGIKTLNTNPIYQCKNAIYFLFFKDNDSIYRMEQVKFDVNYFYDIFNYEFIKFHINQDLPNTFSTAIINSFYESLPNNNNKNFENILVNNKNDNVFERILFYTFRNSRNVGIINIFNNIKVFNNRCTFTPSGDTLFQCRQLCSNNINLSCSEQQCRNICNNCYSESCKWNYSKKVNNEKLRPSRSKIKGFSGDKFIKITWIKPESKSELLKYYVILTTPTNNDFLQIYSFYDERELPEYIVKNLENGIPYGVSIISKNKIGVSDISNIETVIPSENSNLNDYSLSNTYDNSLQNYIENTTEGVDLKIQKSMYEKQMIIQELKDILINNLKIKLDLQAYNVNIF